MNCSQPFLNFISRIGVWIFAVFRNAECPSNTSHLSHLSTLKSRTLYFGHNCDKISLCECCILMFIYIFKMLKVPFQYWKKKPLGGSHNQNELWRKGDRIILDVKTLTAETRWILFAFENEPYPPFIYLTAPFPQPFNRL